MSPMITLGSGIANDLRLAPAPRKILGHLLKGQSITPNEAMLVYHVRNLGDCIMKLRRAGYAVSTDYRKDAVGGRYARYTLEGALVA